MGSHERITKSDLSQKFLASRQLTKIMQPKWPESLHTFYDVQKAKQNISTIYEERRNVIQTICDREMQKGNELLENSNKLHG